MMFLLSIAGLIIGFILFINFISAGGDLKRVMAGKDTSAPETNHSPTLDASRVLKNKPGPTRPRICPVCGTLLTREEYLIAAIEPGDDGRKKQAHIYGCPHCYSTGGVNLKNKVKFEP